MDARTTRTDVNKGLSRRTVLKGTAWTVPALVAVTAAPLAAASHEPGHIGSLVESSANITQLNASMSSIYLDPDASDINTFTNVTITITVTYDPSIDPASTFTLLNATLTPAVTGQWSVVSQTETTFVYESQVLPVLSSTQGVAGLVLNFGSPVWAPLNSISFAGVAVGDNGYTASPLTAAAGSLVGPSA